MNVDDPGRLPDKPSLDQLRKQAKELKASKSLASLSDAQHKLAQHYDYESWPKLKLFVEQTTLRRLIEDGEPAPVERLLNTNRGLANLKFPEGDTPLQVAAGENRASIVELLVRNGANFDPRFGDSAHSALSWAITCWAFDAANKLVELGDEPDLFCAAGLGLFDRVRAFWPNGELVKNPSQTGSSRNAETGEALPRPPLDPQDQVSDALYIACRTDRIEVARFLLERRADPNFRGYAGATCLAWAEFTENEALSDLLRKHGGLDELLDFSYKAPPKVFPIMVYAGWGFFSKLAERLKRDSSVAHLQTEIGTPLHAAAFDGQSGTSKLLLACGADKSVRNAAGLTALDIAEKNGHTKLAELLR